jgi:hypothetical protein
MRSVQYVAKLQTISYEVRQFFLSVSPLPARGLVFCLVRGTNSLGLTVSLQILRFYWLISPLFALLMFNHLFFMPMKRGLLLPNLRKNSGGSLHTGL